MEEEKDISLRKYGITKFSLIFLIISCSLIIGCFKNPNEVIDPDYSIEIKEVSIQNQSLIGETISNDSDVYLRIHLEIKNINSDYGLALSASAFWISTFNNTEIPLNSDIDGYGVIDPDNTHAFSLDFIIFKNEKAQYLHCDLSVNKDNPKKFEIPDY